MKRMDKLHELLQGYGFKFIFDQTDSMFVRGWITSFIIHNVKGSENDEMFSIMSKMKDNEFSEMAKRYYQ
ncbi:hypothetical protein CN918_29200 [Priestia megaterium]|nr:hypothetical protein CN918_29200 [Priestia megaterium]